MPLDNAVMLLALHMIADAHQKDFAAKTLQDLRIVPVPNLVDGAVRGLVPLKLYDQDRHIGTLFGQIDHICIPPAGRELLNPQEFSDAADIGEANHIPQRLLIIIEKRGCADIVGFFYGFRHSAAILLQGFLQQMVGDQNQIRHFPVPSSRHSAEKLLAHFLVGDGDGPVLCPIGEIA